MKPPRDHATGRFVFSCVRRVEGSVRRVEGSVRRAGVKREECEGGGR